MSGKAKEHTRTFCYIAIASACIGSGIATWNSRGDVSSARSDSQAAKEDSRLAMAGALHARTLAMAETKALWKEHYEQAVTIGRIEGKLEALQLMQGRQHSDLRNLTAIVVGIENELDVLKRKLGVPGG